MSVDYQNSLEILVMVEIKKLRKSSSEALSGKLGEKSAAKYETAIYNMCVRLAKQDGEKIESVYTRVAFDKIGQLIATKKPLERTKILNDLKNTVEDWDACIYEQQRFEYDRLMDRSIQKPQAVTLDEVCKYKGCKSNKFYIWSAQTRSADEGMTHFRQCALCNKRKKE